MTERTTEDLLYELKRQFPPGRTTWGGCRGMEQGCRGTARGCGFCSNCCKEKLIKKGCNSSLIDSYIALLTEKRDLINEQKEVPKEMNDKIVALYYEIGSIEKPA